MKDVAKTPYLWKRDGVWYFKRRVPAHLVDRAKTPVVKYSLETSDLAEAKRRLRDAIRRADAWFDGLEAGGANPPPDGKSNLSAPRRITVDELLEHARVIVEEESARHERKLMSDPTTNDEEKANRLDSVGYAVTVANNPTHPEHEIEVDKLAGRIAARAGGTPNDTDLLSVAARALTELARRQEAHALGDFDTVSFDKRFAPLPPGAKPKVGGMSFRQLFDAYIAFKKTGKWAETTEGDMKRVWTIATRVIDPDKLAREVDITDVRAVRDLILTMPVGTIRPKKAKSDAPPPKQLAPGTQEKYFRFFKAVLRWGADEGHLDAAPGSGVKLGSGFKKGQTPKKPYSPGQLKAIFSSALYTGCASAAKNARHKPGDKIIKDGWYWLPLIALFTGMRIGEIVQLLASDVKTEVGITYFDITKGSDEEDEFKRIKNAGSERKMPIPQVLFDLGFGDVIAKAPKSGRLFPEIPIAEGKHPSRTATQWWTRYGRGAGFYHKTTTFHSFRHAFTDAMRDAEILDYVQHALTGHTEGTAHDGYGEGVSIRRLKEAVDKVHYPSIDLSKIGKKA